MKKFVKRYEEAKIKDRDEANSTYYSHTLPLASEILYDKTGGVILYPSEYKPMSYLGKIDTEKFNSYRKELADLFKDIDYIMSKINKKYGLKLKK